jgi:hypothetical protein
MMPRPPRRNGLTIVDLERLLRKRRSAIDELMRERAYLQKRADILDAKIRLLAGRSVVGNGGASRPRNAVSLVATLDQVLAKSGKPLNVGDIVEKVLATGYQSKAANFRALVNQTLIKERKRFANAGRGMYEIKSR